MTEFSLDVFHCQHNELTPWNGVLLEKLIVADIIIKKLFAFYRIRKFINCVHWTLF
jgi:hypothetical protein